MKPRNRLFATLLTAAAVAVGVQAYTASNTVDTSTAGSGAGAVSGYAATAVGYTLNTSDPTKVDAVTFTINPTTTSAVKARLTDSGSFYDCTNTAGAVSCDTSASGGADLSTIDNLTVVAVS